MDRLPVLDLTLLDKGPGAADEFRSLLREATHGVGFFHLVGHGIPDEVMARVFAVAEQFFELPMQDKLAVEMRRSPHFRGCTRTGGELTQGAVDWREQIDLGAERATADTNDGPRLPPARGTQPVARRSSRAARCRHRLVGSVLGSGDAAHVRVGAQPRG